MIIFIQSLDLDCSIFHLFSHEHLAAQSDLLRTEPILSHHSSLAFPSRLRRVQLFHHFLLQDHSAGATRAPESALELQRHSGCLQVFGQFGKHGESKLLHLLVKADLHFDQFSSRLAEFEDRLELLSVDHREEQSDIKLFMAIGSIQPNLYFQQQQKGMDNSQRQIFKHQIELLQAQIEEQRKREQVLHTLNDTLQEQLKIVAAENDQYEEINEQLTDKIKHLKDRHAEDLRYYETENSRLKSELNEKFKEIERKDLQGQRRQLLLQQKVTMLENIIEKKCNKVGDLQKKLHDQSICGFKQTSRVTTNDLPYSRRTDLAVSAIQYSQCETENNMKYSNISSTRQSKMTEIMKLDRSQLKVMMGALIKSKKHLEEGSFDTGMDCASTKRNQTCYQ